MREIRNKVHKLTEINQFRVLKLEDLIRESCSVVKRIVISQWNSL